MIQKTALVALCVLTFTVASPQNDANGQYCSQNSLWAQSLAIQSGGRVIPPNPPYFALHPPVYYEGIVKRPYGISPFAAPPGVLPVEMTITVEPKTVLNPFYKNELISPADDATNPKMKPEIKKESGSKKKAIDITTPAANKESAAVVASKKIINPFFKKKTTLDRHAF